MTSFSVNKRSAGVFLTRKDPFGYQVVDKWVEDIISRCGENLAICEPYAGENNLLADFSRRYGEKLPENTSWCSYDISPGQVNRFPISPIIERNTLMELPDRYDVIITNPPYLARNSARRRGLDFPFGYVGKGIVSPQDLYQISLDTCLAAAAWVCFLIPESFITSSYSKKRLVAVISLPGDLFDDTDCPVCLALFGPETTDDFTLYNQNGDSLGSYTSLVSRSDDVLGSFDSSKFSFNIPDGIIGLRGVDNTREASICFVLGRDVPSEKVKETSRAITRISSPAFDDLNPDEIVSQANGILERWRAETNDVFMTAFKGIRKDGRYRRRLSYDIAARILARACHELQGNAG